MPPPGAKPKLGRKIILRSATVHGPLQQLISGGQNFGLGTQLAPPTPSFFKLLGPAEHSLSTTTSLLILFHPLQSFKESPFESPLKASRTCSSARCARFVCL